MTVCAQQIKIQASTGRSSSLGQTEYEQIRGLIRQVAGISLADNKQSMVQRRLSGRLKALGMRNFSEYCDVLLAGDRSELEHFANAMTTNLTAFFRENHHFDFLANAVLPKLVRASKNRDKTIRIWSAGCSTGEEPYSLAMLINETCPIPRSIDFRILATDIDSDALLHGETGVYTQERANKISQTQLRRWFERGRGGNSGYVRVKPELRRDIAFKQLNLLRHWPMRKKFDVIFCRNVIIYFDKPTQKRLVGRFAKLLRPKGHLFLGHSESLMNVTDRFSLLGQSVYQKVS